MTEYPPTSAQVTPPSPLDGPDELVDWRELEEEGHPEEPEAKSKKSSR